MPDLSRPATPGLHVPYIKSRLPDWTQHLARPHLESLTRARDPARLFAHSYPALYAQASATLRQALLDSQVQSNTSSQALAKTLKDFKGITEFVKPLLEEAMRKTFGQSPDVTRTMLFHLRAPNRADEQTLLQAALRNFEADEPFDEIALQETSALAPAGVRLEVRDGHINGPLIDGIGRETAASRKYVVKQGPAYQAFDERGEALNSVPRSGGNFFDSIMHALPDESRQALGVPHVGQSGGLQKAIFDSAVQHRAPLMQRLEDRAGGRAVFKPPVRVNERQVGYPASGRGQGLNPSLVTRVQSVYPGLSDRNASSFILRQLRTGKSDAQIYGLLQERMREWEALESTLDQWVGTPEPDLQTVLGGKNAVARNLKECWRNSPLAEELPFYSSLDLTCDDPIPPLSADFSHVRELNIRGRCITDANADALLANFPGLKNLRINATGGEFSNVPQALGGMRELTGLSLYSASPRAVDMPSRLGALTTLQELNVYFSDLTPMALDVSRLRNLRSLAIYSRTLRQWPVGVVDLPVLERLNLKNTGIGTLPDGVFEGHEKLWSGLSLDWSNFSREHFKPAFEYVTNHPEHLVDREEMVRDYCKGELSRLAAGMNESIDGLFNRFVEQWQGADARFEAALRILDCWRESLSAAQGAADTVLNLNGLQLGDLPELPAVFDHVGTLNLTGTRLSEQGSNGFLQTFKQLRILELNGNDLQAVPEPVGRMHTLERLELSSNRLSDSDHLYASLNLLQRLQWLDLSYNALDEFDLGVFERLKTLDLRNNNLTDWPVGVLDSSYLRTLNLSGNDITSIPPQALDGSHDVLMSGTDLSDNFNLSLGALEQMQDYRGRGSRATVFGYSRAALDELIDQARNESEAVSGSIESDEDLSGGELEVEQKTPWLANAPPEQVASKTRLWNQLAAEPDNAAFFHLISRLQDTREFQVANADLTRRVWTVMEAAAGNTELRETLFASSNTHGTCVDGRILTFSALESTVYTHNALHEVSAGWPGAKGEALLKLSRRLFRLDKVDALATQTATRTGQDQAEVRLGYRIGLTDGWDDGLELPGQPKHMTYASGVTTRQLAEARREVMNAEHGDVFFEDLIQRDYWVSYLKEKYPEAFRALDEADLSQEQGDGMDVDDARLMEQLFDLTAARNAKMIELSRQEVEAIERSSGAAPLAGTSSR